MATKRSNPSSSGSEEEDAPSKKKSRTLKQVSGGKGSSTATRSKRAGGTRVPAILSAASKTNNNGSMDTVNDSQTISSMPVNGNNNGTVKSFLKTARATRSTPADDPKAKAKSLSNATQVKNTKSNNAGTKGGDNHTHDSDIGISRRRKGGKILSLCLIASNIASIAYIVSQHTTHNLAQMRCASTVNKLQLELSNAKDEMKLLRKAIETLEGGYPNPNLTLEDSNQLLTSDDLQKWQKLLDTLEEDKMQEMNEFNIKLKSLA